VWRLFLVTTTIPRKLKGIYGRWSDLTGSRLLSDQNIMKPGDILLKLASKRGTFIENFALLNGHELIGSLRNHGNQTIRLSFVDRKD